MRTSTVALALVIATTSAVGCTLFNDMNGYTGGFGDTGVEPELDTGSKTDSATPPADTGPRDTGVVDTAVTDTGTATTMDTGSPMDSGVDTSVVDTAMPDTSMPDTSMPDTAMPDTSVVDTGTDAPVGCHVVVNEVQTRGTTAGDEFIELYNPCTSTIDLSAYKVVYRSATGTSDVTVATIPSGKSISPGGFYVVGNGSFATTADQPFSASGIADDGGAGVRDSAGTLLDSVGWGTATNAFIETAAVARPATGASISRVPNGTDTDNNSVDFKATSSTPKS